MEMASDVASYDLNAIQDESLLRKMVRRVEMPPSHNMYSDRIFIVVAQSVHKSLQPDKIY